MFRRVLLVAGRSLQAESGHSEHVVVHCLLLQWSGRCRLAPPFTRACPLAELLGDTLHRSLHVRPHPTTLFTSTHALAQTIRSPSLFVVYSLTCFLTRSLPHCSSAYPDSWLFQQPLRMSPIPPETLERLLLHGCEEGREPVSQQMRELMTKLAISRRSSTDARLVAQLKKGEACGWRHIHDIVKQRLDTWWHEWREDEEEDEQREEGDDEQSEEAANGSHDKDDKGEDEEDNRPLPGQSHDYTGPISLPSPSPVPSPPPSPSSLSLSTSVSSCCAASVTTFSPSQPTSLRQYEEWRRQMRVYRHWAATAPDIATSSSASPTGEYTERTMQSQSNRENSRRTE